MGTSPIRPFNALNGEEVKKIILTAIQNHLDADSRFKRHLTYPQVSWRFKLAIDAYPMEPSKLEIEVGPQTVRAPGTPPLPADAPVVEIDLSGGSDVTAPAEGGITADAARREAGLPVPAPTAVRAPGPGRVTVDVPDSTPKSTAPLPSDSPREVTNVQHEGKIFARSVTQRTNAAPDGVETAPQAGTKPGIEDVQEIIRREEGAPPDDAGNDVPPAA